MTDYESTHGSIVHVEFYSDDVEASQGFYENAFGWTFEPAEGQDYTMWRAPNPPNGGLLARDAVEFPAPPTLFYVQVDDLAAAQAAIAEAGGELLVEEMEVPEMGVFAVFRDPGGVVAAAWEDRYEGEPPEGGFPRFTDEPDPGSIVHFELYTDDPAATQALDEAVFDWQFEAVGAGGYPMAEPPTPPFGGIMEASEEMPVGPLAYLLVDDAADAVQTIRGAGGRVVRAPFDIEGWGTMAVFEAPGGVVQAVWEAAAGRTESPAAASSRANPSDPED